MAIQQLTQPILNPIVAFDATKSNTISFIVIGGAQVIGNRLVISDNKTGQEVYNKVQSTMKLEHLIPANTLKNGGYYNAVIYTIDNGGNESSASIAIPFYCYSQPILTIDNIPITETIENGTYKFTGNYLQLEKEILNSYQYTLYDSNKEILSQSPLIYYETDNSLSYTFVGMSNDTSYYVELTGQTINGTKISSGLRYFTVRYLQPASFAICDLVNNCEDGYIQISSNIVAIDGNSNPKPPIYIDDKEVDLRDPNAWVEWSEGFRIQNNFTMRAWGRDFNPYEKIITLTNNLNSEKKPNKIELKWMLGDTIKKLPEITTVYGKNVNLVDSENDKITNLSIRGSSRQNSEPEKDFGTEKSLSIDTIKQTPLQVNILGNVEQDVREGYNLYDYIPRVIATTKGLNVTKDIENGYLIVNGTPETDYVSIITGIDITDKLKDKTTYTLWQEKYDIKLFLQINARKVDDSGYTYINAANQKKVFTVDKSKYIQYTITIQTGLTTQAGTFSNYKNRYMLYEGTDDKPYEQYGASPSLEYPSEIRAVGDNINLLETTAKMQTVNGVTFTVNEDGTVIANGTATSLAQISLVANLKLSAGTYTIKDAKAYVESEDFNDWFDGLNNPSTLTFNTEVLLKNVYIQVKQGETVNNKIFYPKLEKGTVATSYSKIRTR